MPVRAIPSDRACLVELFSSAQGEGPLVGCRQVFIRFCGCNLKCAYCDTDHVGDAYCRFETTPGSQSFEQVENPVPLHKVLNVLMQWKQEFPKLHHSISLTGGEPLHHGNTLIHWLPELRKILPIYLESNGTQPSVLADLIDEIDYVSMDIKLESVCGFKTPWERHADFLDVADGKICCVKLVVDLNTPTKEVVEAAKLVCSRAGDATVVIQPVTRQDRVMITASRLLELQAAALEHCGDVRIIPQTHRFIELL